MRKLLMLAALAAATLFVLGAGAASADSGSIGTLDLPRPAWLTDTLEAQIVAAGTQGLEIVRPDATVNPDCLGTAPPAVDASGVSTTAAAAGACLGSPAGRTVKLVLTERT